MSDERRGPGGVTCIEVVELMSDYVEGALSPDDLARFEEHLSLCPPCREFLAQIRATIAAAGRVGVEEIPQETIDALLDAFRDWRSD